MNSDSFLWAFANGNNPFTDLCAALMMCKEMFTCALIFFNEVSINYKLHFVLRKSTELHITGESQVRLMAIVPKGNVSAHYTIFFTGKIMSRLIMIQIIVSINGNPSSPLQTRLSILDIIYLWNLPSHCISVIEKRTHR